MRPKSKVYLIVVGALGAGIVLAVIGGTRTDFRNPGLVALAFAAISTVVVVAHAVSLAMRGRRPRVASLLVLAGNCLLASAFWTLFFSASSGEVVERIVEAAGALYVAAALSLALPLKSRAPTNSSGC